MSTSKIAVLGSKIQYLTADIQHSLENKTANSDSHDELLDTIEDLLIEAVEPMKWTGSILAPPDFSVMQVAFQCNIFQHVPLKPPGTGKGEKEEEDGTMPSISIKELAGLVKIEEGYLLRIMRLLASSKIFIEIEEKKFAHTKLSAGMAEENVAAHLGGLLNDVYKASTSLTDAIQGGHASAWEARFGMPMYEYFEKNLSQERVRLAKSMVSSSREELKQLARDFPWERFAKVVDIGGGAGHLAAYLAQQHPHLHTVNQDLPLVINDALQNVSKLPEHEKTGYDRVEFQVHNYFEPQPRRDADIYTLRRCLHNNTDEVCVRILKAVVPGLEAGGSHARLLIIEKLLPAWNAYSTRRKTKWLRREDILMMISVGGKERSLEEFGELLKTADERFEIDQVYPERDHFAVVSAKLVTA